MVFTFEHVQIDQSTTKFDVQPFDLIALKTVMARWQEGLGEVGWNSLYWCNHDQPRIVSRWGDDRHYRVEAATMLATVLHLHRGTPFIYQGEEFGMTNAPLATLDDIVDIESRDYANAAARNGVDARRILDGVRLMGRDNARTPMQWDSSPHAGFTTGVPWMPLNPNHRHINAAAARADRRSVWHHYQRLIALRHDDPVVTDGHFAMLLPEHPSIYAYTRKLNDNALLVLGNFSGATQTIELPAEPAWLNTQLELGNYPYPTDPTTLRPWEARVYRQLGSGVHGRDV